MAGFKAYREQVKGYVCLRYGVKRKRLNTLARRMGWNLSTLDGLIDVVEYFDRGKEVVLVERGDVVRWGRLQGSGVYQFVLRRLKKLGGYSIGGAVGYRLLDVIGVMEGMEESLLKDLHAYLFPEPAAEKNIGVDFSEEPK